MRRTTSKLDYQSFQWKEPLEMKPSKAKPFVGYDTETCKGNVGLIANSNREIIWKPRTSVPVQDILRFMWSPNTHGVWFNLGYDIECIIKQMHEESIDALVCGEPVVYQDWTLRTIPKKMFRMQHNVTKEVSMHFDIAQFYNSSLKKAAQKYLNLQKLDDTIDVQQLGSTWNYWKPNKDNIQTYCIQDAIITQQLADQWRKLAHSLNVDFSYPVSPANIAGKFAQTKNWPKWPKILHRSIGLAAWSAYAGGRFESRIKGANDYHGGDIRSAYPSVLTDLPNPNLQWTRSRSQRQALDAPWGFVNCDVSVSLDLPWSPIPVRRSSQPLFFPSGNLGERWLTLEEWKHYRKAEGVSIKFKKAWIGHDDGERPFSWVKDLWKKRNRLKLDNDPLELIIKIMLNSLYGKCLERIPTDTIWRIAEEADFDNPWDLFYRDGSLMIKENRKWKIGSNFNPILASHITGLTRLNLWKVTEECEVASKATDGVLTLDPIPRKYFGSDLGQWEDLGKKPGVIVGNGLYQRIGEKPKSRGFGRPTVNWNWIEALENAKPTSDKINVKFKRPLHVGEALQGYKSKALGRRIELTDVGNFVTEAKDIKLNDDKKRLFPKVTARSLLEDSFDSVTLVLGA